MSLGLDSVVSPQPLRQFQTQLKALGGREASRETKAAFDGHLGQLGTMKDTSLKTQGAA